MDERLISAQKLQQYAASFRAVQGVYIRQAQKDEEAAREMVAAGVEAAKAEYEAKEKAPASP